jgi:hypothetical protein
VTGRLRTPGRLAERLRALVPTLWLGMLVSIALLAAPAAFATLSNADAGRLVARLFAHEARLSLVLGVVVVLIERQRVRSFDTTVLLALGAVFCTVAGYYALQPMMAQAHLGQGRWSFGQLHAASLGFYGLKTLLVAALAWRAALSAPAPTS